jgi:hypothetical protein
VVGIVKSKLAGAEGIGFATPANALSMLLGRLDTPRTPTELRDFLKSTIYPSGDLARYPGQWVNLSSRAGLVLKGSAQGIDAEIQLPHEFAKLGGFRRLAFKLKDSKWIGASYEHRVCAGLVNGSPTAWLCKVAPMPAELTFLTPYRIEGKADMPTDPARFDCSSCSYHCSVESKDFVWVPGTVDRSSALE